MMGLEDTGNIPFRYVYLHGLIRDEKGEKMSKTKGNVLNPLDLMEKYGTDALRFAVINGTSPGNDSKLGTDKLEAGQNFANKLWNATRFVVQSLKPGVDLELKRGSLPIEDRWILSRLHHTIATVNNMMENFQFAEAERTIYDFLWGDYCDWYIELAKIRLRSPAAVSPVPVLVQVLETSLRLLHPFMPFVTEELWQNLKNSMNSGEISGDSIMIAAYPISDNSAYDNAAERVMSLLIDIIHAIRNARAEHKVEMNRWIESRIYAGSLSPAVKPYTEAIQILGRTRPVTFLDSRPDTKNDNTLVMVLQEAEVFIPMASMVDAEAERKRLEKEAESSQAEAARLEARLADQAFLSKAPPAVVEKERQRLFDIKDRLARLKEQLVKL